MPDTKEDRAVQNMEADVKRMAATLRPTIATAAPMPSTRDTVTVGKLRSALDVLQANAEATLTHVRLTGWRLAGGERPAPHQPGQPPDRSGDEPEPVFQALATQVVLVSRTMERIEQELKRIDGALS